MRVVKCCGQLMVCMGQRGIELQLLDVFKTHLSRMITL